MPRRWPLWAAAGLGAALLVAAGAFLLRPRTPRHPAAAVRSHAPAAAFPAASFSPQNPPPAWPGALPYPLLIADGGAGRIVEVSPAGKVLWSFPQAGTAPATAAAWTAGGDDLLLVGEDQGLAEEVAFPAGTVVWRYPAQGALNHPTAAAALGDGGALLADTRDCRVLLLSPTAALRGTWGAAQTGYCTSDPAAGRLGYPESVAVEGDGDVLVGLAAGDQVALLSPSGTALWTVPAPPLYGGFVVDATPGSGSLVVVTGFSDPGTVTAFDPATGAVAWTIHPTSGPDVLDDPRAALLLPDGDVAVADSGHGRVLVFDPRSGAVLWQYGGPGALSGPTGLALDLWRDWRPAAGS